MTVELTVALVTVGLVALVVLVLTTLRRVRRCTRANAQLRTALSVGVAPLRAGVQRPGSGKIVGTGGEPGRSDREA